MRELRPIPIVWMAVLTLVASTSVVVADDAEDALKRGIEHAKKGEYNDAVGEFTRAIELKPDYVEAYIQRGTAYIELEKTLSKRDSVEELLREERSLRLALDDFAEALKLDPKEPRAYYYRGVIYSKVIYEKGRPVEKGRAEFKKAIELKPDYVDALLALAEPYIHMDCNDHLNCDREAMRYLDKVFNIAPGEPRAYYYRSIVSFNARHFDRAIEDLTKAVELKPDYIPAWLQRGRVYWAEESYEKTISDFDHVLSIDPANYEALWHRGMVWEEMGQHERAIKDFTDAINLQPDNPMPYDDRGLVYYNRGDYADALRDFEMAVSLDPNCQRGYVALLHTCMAIARLGDHRAAIERFNKVPELSPKNPWAYSYRGTLYSEVGRFDEAMADFDRAIELYPEFADFYLERAEAYRCKGESGKAVADADRAVSLDPEYADAWMLRGSLRFDGGAYEQAIVDFRKLIELSPSDAKARIWLFLATTRLGRDGKPDLATFRKALKDDDWMINVVRMYLGEITPEACLSAAAHKDPRRDNEQKCHAYYHMGQFYLLRGDKTKAREMFEKSVARGVAGLVECESSKAELVRLK